MLSSLHAGRDAASGGSLSRLGVAALRKPLRTVSFWAAIALPLVHVPLLFTGVESMADSLLVFGLLALNVVALVAGHGHRSD